MRLESFHPDVRQILLGIGSDKVLTGDIQWVSLASTVGYEWLRGKIDAAQLHQDINGAVGECSAGRNDLIVVSPGHVETLGDTTSTGAVDLSVAGIDVIGLGRGTDIPRIDFGHADSDFFVSASNIRTRNLHLRATVTGVKIGIAISASVTDTAIEDCRMTVSSTATDEFLIAINLLAGCDFTRVTGNHVDMGLGGAAAGVKLVGASNDVDVVDNVIKGDYSVANINGDTTLSKEVLIKENLLMNGGSGAIGAVPVISMLTGTTGYVWRNLFLCNVATVALMAIADAMFFSENYATEDVGEAADSIVTGAAASVAPMADD